MSSIFIPDKQDSLPILTCDLCTVGEGNTLIIFCDFCAAATFGALAEHEQGLLRTFDEIACVLAEIAALRLKGTITTAEGVDNYFQRRGKN
jgi:hypothetical protein